MEVSCSSSISLATVVNLKLECLQCQSQDLPNVDDPVLELERMIKVVLAFNVDSI